jgi:Na+/H+ antiporter NhaD/arsenite permease-like protein
VIVLAVLLLPGGGREVVIIAAAAIAWITTPAARRRENRFTAAPMLEVAAVFLGIFITLIPALELLRARGSDLGVREPWEFFWATGALSAFLDNAPTYLAFLAIGQGLGLPDEVVGITHRVLAGISLGAVCLGANSYIGNAPNFMVRAIAEEKGIAMPGFFAYMGWAAAILLPLYAALTWLFV